MRIFLHHLDRAIGETVDERICNLVSLILVAVLPTLYALATISQTVPQ